MGRSKTRFPKEVQEAVRAAEQAFRANGYGDAGTVGSYYPRPIGGMSCDMVHGGYGCSLHGYGLAFDIDPNLNPHYRRRMTDDLWGRIKLTKLQVRAVEAIRTVSGDQVWKWLGWAIGDTMHFQINVSPNTLATDIDWNTVPGGAVVIPERNDTLFCEYKDGFGQSSGDPVVAYWQHLLKALGADIGPDGIDGKFGDDTAAAVKQIIGWGDGKQIDAAAAASIQIKVGKLGSVDKSALHRGDTIKII